MRRLLFGSLALLLVFGLSCSRETPAPPPSASTTTTTTAARPQVTTTSVPVLQKGTYDEALLWFRSVNAFHFVLDDGGVHAEGDVTRSTPGAPSQTSGMPSGVVSHAAL